MSIAYIKCQQEIHRPTVDVCGRFIALFTLHLNYYLIFIIKCMLCMHAQVLWDLTVTCTCQATLNNQAQHCFQCNCFTYTWNINLTCKLLFLYLPSSASSFLGLFSFCMPSSLDESLLIPFLSIVYLLNYEL